MELLQREYCNTGRGALFDALEVYLSGEKNPLSHAEAAQRMKMTEGAVKVAVHRLRQRYAETLRTEIAQTVARPEDVDEEIRHLFAVLA